MIESSLHREWVSECACVYTKFDPIDFRTSHDIAMAVKYGKNWPKNTEY